MNPRFVSLPHVLLSHYPEKRKSRTEREDLTVVVIVQKQVDD